MSQPQQLALMATPKKERTVDLICGAFDMNQRRKFVVKNADGERLLDLYFKPVARADRLRVQELAGSDEALKLSTTMLCQMAELEDGSKAFSLADVVKLQRELPEKVLNEFELFLFDLAGEANVEEAKND